MPKPFTNFRKNIGSIYNKIFPKRINQIHDFTDIATIPEIGNRPTPTGTQRTTPTGTQRTTPTGSRGTPTGTQRTTPTASQRTTPTGSQRTSPTASQITTPTGSRGTPTATPRTSPTGSRGTPTATPRTSPTGSRGTPTVTQRTTPTGSRGTPTGTQRTSTASRGTPRTSPTGSRGIPTVTQRTPTASQITPTASRGTPRTSTGTPRSPVLSRQRMFANKEKEKKLHRDAKPDHLTDMPDDVLGVILKKRFGHLSPFVFSKEFLQNLTSQEVALFKPLTKDRELPRIETYLLPKIKVIDLQDITLNKYMIEVLDMTVTHSKVSTIILRNITFENIDDINKFLAYLGKNTQIDTLILRNVQLIKESARTGVMKYLKNFLYTIGMLNNIKYLEFSNFDILNEFEMVDIRNHDHYFARHFVKTLIKLEKLEYLIFNNNNIDIDDYYDIFQNSYVIDEYMTHPEDVIKQNMNMLYVVKKYFTPEGRKRMHIVSVKNNKPIKQNDKPVINCIDRRGNDFYTIGNKDTVEVEDIAEYKNIFVMNQIKTKKKELFEKYNIRLTLTNSSSGSGSGSGSRRSS